MELEPSPENELSASLWSKGKIAVRGITSLFKPSESAGPENLPSADVVSEDTRRDRRIPPGQMETKKWPVLHVGPTLHVDLEQWTFRIWGEVESARQFTWREFRALPVTRVFADMHCVTRWSMLDNLWEGVRVADVLGSTKLKPEARFVLVHGENGYTTNLALDDLLGDDCLFAWSRNGRELSPDHGWPLRLVVPKLYAWKSVKWVRGIQFLDHDVAGFWEENGYHNHGDPWTQERFW